MKWGLILKGAVKAIYNQCAIPNKTQTIKIKLKVKISIKKMRGNLKLSGCKKVMQFTYLG